MLTKFTVTNFKSFTGSMTFDLGHPGSYEFNTEAVRDGVITKAMVYGFNGCGKSNLGLAMLDITAHLTDLPCSDSRYKPYLNLDSDNTKSTILEYQFRFDGIEVVYRYEKRALNQLLMESLSIGGQEVIYYDFTEQNGFVRLVGAETLNFNANHSNISRVKFVHNNTILPPNHQNIAFKKFMAYVPGMLLMFLSDFSNKNDNKIDREYMMQSIIDMGKVEDLEHFLQESNVNLHLDVKKLSDGSQTLYANFQHGEYPFWDIISTGTRALTLFYFMKLIMGTLPFVFLDEFDAFYHFELAESIVKLVTKSFPDTQVIFTTHNTDLLSNDILRPDCYFWLDNSKITPLCDLTDKDIRKAHNLQKMFKAGAFQGGRRHD